MKEGFVILENKDTLLGGVELRLDAKNYQSCIFRDSAGIKEFFPNDILGFGYKDSKFFSSRVIDNSFVEVLLRGTVNLYKKNDTYYVKKDSVLYTLETSFEETVENGSRGLKENNRWRGLTSYLVSDCLTNVESTIMRLDFTEKDLTNYFLKYNQCTGSDFDLLKKSQKQQKVEVGASIGVVTTFFDLNPRVNNIDDVYYSVDPSIGMFVSGSSPRYSENFSFQGELHLYRSRFTSSLKHNVLSVPVSMKYTFPERKYAFCFQAGSSMDFYFNPKAKVVRKTAVNDQEITFDYKSLVLSYFGGIGLTKSYHKIRVGLSARYFFSMRVNTDNSLFFARNNRAMIQLFISRK